MNIYNNLPIIDLHGETSDISKILVHDFISDCYKEKYKKLVIIHGIGTGILKNTTHQELKNNKLVKSYKLDNFNIGQTIVELDV